MNMVWKFEHTASRGTKWWKRDIIANELRRRERWMK